VITLDDQEIEEFLSRGGHSNNIVRDCEKLLGWAGFRRAERKERAPLLARVARGIAMEGSNHQRRIERPDRASDEGPK
jgi:hypothetical protein